MEFKPIRSARLSDRVVEEILLMVKEGHLKPGDKLPSETVLAEQFGVSRGILREALTILQSQGYIRRKPKDGTYLQDSVKDMLMSHTINEVIKKATYGDLIDFRAALEEKVVATAVDKASDGEIDELLEILNRTDKDDKPSSIDYYFHYKLAEISGNAFYMNFIDTYYDLISEIANRSYRNEQRWKQVASEHMVIATAMAARDKAAAVKAIRHHLLMVERNLNGLK